MARTAHTQNPLLSKVEPIVKVKVKVIDAEIGIINTGKDAGKLDYTNLIISEIPAELKECGMGLDNENLTGSSSLLKNNISKLPLSPPCKLISLFLT